MCFPNSSSFCCRIADVRMTSKFGLRGPYICLTLCRTMSSRRLLKGKLHLHSNNSINCINKNWTCETFIQKVRKITLLNFSICKWQWIFLVAVFMSLELMYLFGGMTTGCRLLIDVLRIRYHLVIPHAWSIWKNPLDIPWRLIIWEWKSCLSVNCAF